MTSVAFIMGVVPLVFSSGAGVEIRQAMGIAVFAGMLGVTLFGLFLTPVFYVVDRPARSARLARTPSRSPIAPRTRRGGTLIMRLVMLGRAAGRWSLARRAALRDGPTRRRCSAPVAVHERRSGAVRRAAVRSALVGAVRGSGARRAGRAALAANHDVRMAVARVDQARAVFDDVALDRYPSGHGRRSGRSSRRGDSRFLRRAARITDVSRRLRCVLGARSVRPRAVARCARRPPTPTASRPPLDDVRVSVAAEVARNYFELRGLQQQLAVAERSLLEPARDAAPDDGPARRGLRRGTGRGERRGARRRRSKPASRRSGSAIAQREHRLAVLIGGGLGRSTSISRRGRIRRWRRRWPIGEPDTLLRRRPDVRAAERRLAAATASEGVAAADLYPHITHQRLPRPARRPRQPVQHGRHRAPGR